MPFTVSLSQYQALLQRQTALENTVNDLIVAIEKFVTVGQVNSLLTLNAAELEVFRTELESFSTRLSDIENEPLT